MTAPILIASAPNTESTEGELFRRINHISFPVTMVFDYDDGDDPLRVVVNSAAVMDWEIEQRPGVDWELDD